MKMRLLIGVLLLAVLAVGQATKPATPKTGTAPGKSAAPAKATTTAKPAGTLPSRATVDSFLHHVFGWDPQMKLTVKDIKASPAATVAEIDVQAQTPNGPSNNAIYVTSDHKTAIAGQMVPFAGQPGATPTHDQLDGFIKQMTGNAAGLTWSMLEAKPNALDNLMEVTV